MAVGGSGTGGSAWDAILYLVAPLGAACWGAENGCQVEENGFLDSGRRFLEPTAKNWDAHRRVEQGGVMVPQVGWFRREGAGYPY